jgi:uncharacterized protein YecT (DUF1311 family)
MTSAIGAPRVEHAVDVISKTPLPTILVVAGLVFWVLALAGSLAGRITVRPDQRNIAAVLGTVCIGIGITLFFVDVASIIKPQDSKDKPKDPKDTEACPRLLKPRGRERPSFHCAYAQEPIERLMCADADLAYWDGEMGRIYHEKLDQQKAAEDKESLMKQQHAWQRERDEKCDIPDSSDLSACQLAKYKDCVLELIKMRVKELNLH